MTDFRAELQALVSAYDKHGGRWPQEDVVALLAAVDRARAALAEPEPEVPKNCWLDDEPDLYPSSCVFDDPGECIDDCKYATQLSAAGEPKTGCKYYRQSALPEPEPGGPTDEELDDLFVEIDQSGESQSWRSYARAVLARWGRPASQPADGDVVKLAAWLRDNDANWDAEEQMMAARAADLLSRLSLSQPIPVSERLPGPGDCLDEGWAWFFNPRTGWRQATQPVHSTYTHWLPAHALPVPADD